MRRNVFFSFDKQKECLLEAGYPDYVLVAVAESALKKFDKQNVTGVSRTNAMKMVVLPYIHSVTCFKENGKEC